MDERSRMEPAPVGVEHNATRDGSASARSSASRPGEGRVRFGSVGTDLLSVRDSKVGEGEKSGRGEHGD